MGNENTTHNFATADIKEFVNELNVPKQEFEQKTSIFDNLPEDVAQEIEPQEPKVKTKMTTGAANASGKLVVSVIDTVIPSVQAWFAKDDTDGYKAPESNRSEMEEAFSRYMELKGGDIPPGLMCLILVITIYGSNIPKMLEMRKLNTEKENLEKMRRDLEFQRKQLDAERENFNKKAEK